jgi:hypothetical protein
MPRTYATPAQLAEYTNEAAPDDAVGLLRSASLLIGTETRTARYPVDKDGYPRDPALLADFRNAACAQAAFWAGLKIKPYLGAAGIAPVASSKSIRSASFQYAATADTARARADAATQLAPDAWRILDDAGLLNTPPGSY